MQCTMIYASWPSVSGASYDYGPPNHSGAIWYTGCSQPAIWGSLEEVGAVCACSRCSLVKGGIILQDVLWWRWMYTPYFTLVATLDLSLLDCCESLYSERNPLISWKSDVDAGCVGIVVIWWQILTMLGFHSQPLMSRKMFRDWSR